jgi:ABC-type glycerol-3-phosphate transport system permease component
MGDRSCGASPAIRAKVAAAAIIVTLPVLLLKIVIQKEILTGMAAGGVKRGG